jgi:hypothetical protein
MCCTKATLPTPAGRNVGVRLQCYDQPNPTDMEAGVPWEHARQSLRDRAPSHPLAHMQTNSIPASRRAGDGRAAKKAKGRMVEELSEAQGFAAAARYLLSDHRSATIARRDARGELPPSIFLGDLKNADAKWRRRSGPASLAHSMNTQD